MTAEPNRVAEGTVANSFEATVSWTGRTPMLQGRAYLLRLGTVIASATVAPLKYRIEPSTDVRTPAKTLVHGEVGVCNLDFATAIAFDATNTTFTILDPDGSEMLGSGRLHFPLRRSQNVRWQHVDVDKRQRARRLGQKPCVIWFTGLSGAGKSTIANLLEQQLQRLGRHTYLLDGDNVRHGLNRDLGFAAADRVENIRRVAEVARLMVDAGLIVLVSLISPFRSERHMARGLVEADEFVEVFVDVPIDVAEARDPKGLYRKARQGELPNFTGIDSPYEPPEHPEVHVDTTSVKPQASAEAILMYLMRIGILEDASDGH